MAAFALPASLEEQLEGLAAEVRRLRILRGVSCLVAVLIAAPAVAIALDASLELSGRARGALLAGWVALGIVAGWWFVVRRFRETLSPEELARIIEEKFPSLAERLRTLVELSEHADAGNGSRTMMALLARETERRTKKLDFHRAAPSGFSFRMAGSVAIAGLLAFAPLLFVRDGGERVRRLVAPWRSPPVEVPYEVVVSSGDPVVKRGQPITVSGYLRKLQPNAVLPDSAAVLFRESGSADEKKLPMLGDDKSAFTLTRPSVAGDLEYCIESGAVRSGWHTIAAVDPVEVAAGSEVTIAAPAYAAALRPTRTVPTLADFEGLQHGKATLILKMNRRAEDVQLEWRSHDAKAIERLAVRLDESRTSATAEVPLRADGTLKWILFAEKDIRTEVAQAVRVLPDTPPKFDRVTGLPAQARDIRPGEELSIAVVASDDLAIANAFLDFGPADAVDESSLKSEPVMIPGLGTERAEGTVKFRLPAGATEGQAFRVRLRIQDNRSIPELDWKSQRSTYPDKSWAILRVSTGALPLAEQDLVAERDGSRRKLDAIRKLLEKAHDDIKPLRLEFQGRAKLEQDQSIRVGADLEAVREALGLLEASGREDGRPTGSLAQELADVEVRTAEVQLKKILTETDPTPRDTAALSAQHALEAALLKLAALSAGTDKASEKLLEQTRLEQLAKDQAKLADDAKASKSPEELAAEQRGLKDDLQKLVEQSETLKAGESDAEAERRSKLAEELRRIARTQQKLDEAIRAGNRDADAGALDELAKKQKALTEKMRRLGDKTDLAARVAQTAPLEQKPSRAAADLLEQKKAIDALTEQEKAARDLDRLADALDKSATDRGDARKAAQQLARWQDDLQRRIADGTKQTPRGDSPADREKWAAEQTAIRDATAKLPLPPSPPLDKAHRQANDATAGAAEQLKRDPAQAAESVKKAAEALNQLAEKTPTQQQRVQAAALELEKLRKEQETIAKVIDDALRLAKDAELERKLTEAAEKQDELAKKVAKLDAPGSKARRTKAVDAAQRAKEDLQKGRIKDAAESQREAKLELDRLKESLNGQTPADEQAGELDRLQKELTENLTKLDKPSADELQRLQRLQNEIARRLQQLQAPEAQKPLQDARDASQAADAALKKTDPDTDELKKKSREASAATARLSEELNKEKTAQAAPKVEEPEANLPNKNDAGEARELAKEQRGLRDQLSRLAEKTTKAPQPSQGDPLKELAEAQEQLAKDAEQLARDAKASEQPDAAAKAEEAAKKAHAAGEKLAVGDVQSAGKELDAAREKLGDAARVATKPELSARAEELQKRQTELGEEAKKKGGQPGTGMARQQAKQKQLAKEAGELADKLGEQKSAADPLKRAASAMERAAENKPAEAAQARKRAAEELAESQKAMAGDAAAPKAGSRAEAARAAATATRQARESMQQAEKELAKPGGSGAAERAAQQLKQAAGKLGEANRPGERESGTTTGANAGPPDKPATQSAVPSVVQENLGKAWGNLPGAVKTQITQELKAKYGDDYARLIKLYFEQLAERK